MAVNETDKVLNFVNWGMTYMVSKVSSSSKILRLPLCPVANNQGRLVAKHHAPAFQFSSLSAISVPNSALGSKRRSGIICTLPATQEFSLQKSYLSFFSFCGKVLSGWNKETWQDILGKVRCFGKRTGRGRVALLSKCSIS